MYAIISSGSKQEKVSKGQQVQVELLGVETGSEVSFTPVMLVDGENVLATPAQLAKASVKGK
ncbi:MAG: 50S ribosomal protein L21, partial [Actinobacteria bacterium]|nr:50S ribosomal protein L21 [Actinomycetota bacterium]